MRPRRRMWGPDLIPRDDTDQLVLRSLIDGAADELVTGDKNLLVLADTYPIVSPRAFLDRHGLAG